MKSISDLDIAGKTVLLRSDFNVPLAKDGSGVITDDGRIVASLPTLKALTGAGAKVVIVAHLGRPKGVGFEESGSLAPVAKRLGELLGQDIALASDVTGESAKATVAALQPGQVALLENIRFDARETSKDEAQRKELAAELAAMADVYVSDGFGVVHRKQASVTDVAELLPNAAGLLVEKEVKSFSKVLADPDRPYVVILGGSKVSDKLGVIDNLIDSVDRLLIGGGMAYTFLAAQGHTVGDSLLESDQIEAVKGYIAKAAGEGDRAADPGRHPRVGGLPQQGRARAGEQGRAQLRDRGRLDGPGHRPGDHRAVLQQGRRRPHRGLERTDGRVRVPRVRRRHAAGRHRRSPRPVRSR